GTQRVARGVELEDPVLVADEGEEGAAAGEPPVERALEGERRGEVSAGDGRLEADARARILGREEGVDRREVGGVADQPEPGAGAGGAGSRLVVPALEVEAAGPRPDVDAGDGRTGVEVRPGGVERGEACVSRVDHPD